MKRIYLALIIFVFTGLFISAKSKNESGIITTNYSSDKKFYSVVYVESDFSNSDIFAFFPDCPDGYHLISIETYIFMEKNQSIKRVYIFTNEDSIKTFSVSGTSQTYKILNYY